MRILVINPGSTSTKISVYDDEAELFTQSVFHDAPQLLQYPTTNDQLPMRRAVVEDLLRVHGIPMDSIDVFVGRGGCAYSQKAGVMRIDQRMDALPSPWTRRTSTNTMTWRGSLESRGSTGAPSPMC